MLCELCQSEPAHNFHHFIPRKVHGNKWFKKRFTRQQMARGIEVWRRCHRAIHRIVPDEKELGRHHHSVEALLEHEKLARYVTWKRSRRGRRTTVQ